MSAHPSSKTRPHDLDQLRNRLDAALDRFRWQSLRVRLRNTRQAHAREHPLYVFKAIFMHATASLPGVTPGNPWRPQVFHPIDRPLPNRVERNRLYELELCFPGDGAESAALFAADLQRRLADPENNFALESITPAETRSVAGLIGRIGQGDWPGLDPAADEVCLDFLTPFRWNRPTVDREAMIRWRFRPDQLLLHLARRAAQLLPGLGESEILAVVQAEFDNPAGAAFPLSTLPYYWHFDQFGHRPKTDARFGGSPRQLTVGMSGPLYLRGPWQRLLPLLLLGSQWHIGNKISQFQGHFSLSTDRPFFDRRLARIAPYREALETFEENSDAADELAQSLESRETLLEGMRQEVSSGAYRPETARSVRIPKSAEGEWRAIAVLPPRDQVIHRALHDALAPVFERMFEDASVGYRKGRSVATAREMIAGFVREGCTHALESDIEAFFDQIDHEILHSRLDAALPRGDRVLRVLLERVAAHPCAEGGVAPAEDLPRRTRGLLQGSPLSPLLANFYLDPFDEALEAAGWRLVRFGDDFLILCQSREEAERALAEAEAELEKLRLSLVEEKTAISPVDLGLTFLGIDLGAELHEQFVEQTALRKPAFVGPDYSFVGVSGQSVVIKRDGEIVGQVPMQRLSELVLLGVHTLSTRLLQVCSSRRIPVSFCGASGYYINTLRPDSRRHFEMLARHAARFAALAPAARVGLARRIGYAKIANYLRWLDDLPLEPADREKKEFVARLLPQFDAATGEDEVRGLEGRAAATLFPLICGLVRVDGFASKGREPHRKPDRWNSLLDFGYFLLFTRLNVLTRGRGLDPYLGFLHSHQNRYESLVCDLQEPFRARIDRMIVKLVNRKVIAPDDFEETQRERSTEYRLGKPGSGRFIQAFEREMETELAGDPGKLRHLLCGQVAAVERWARAEGGDLKIYLAE